VEAQVINPKSMPSKAQAERIKQRWIDAHAAYHGAIMEAAGSVRLQQAVEATTALMPPHTLWDAIGDRPYPLGAIAARHAELARLIESRDKSGASECMRWYVLGLGDAFLIWWDRTANDGATS
jgi:DNA-binding GntR family transcriptional regulator